MKEEESRSQVEKLILENMQAEQKQQDERLQKMKARYEQIGEKAFLEEFKEQTGMDLPDEVLAYLRS